MIMKPGGPRSMPQRSTLIICAVFTVLELVFSGNLNILGVPVRFLLILTAVLALMYGSRTGAVAGFALGLLMDLLGSNVVGISALLMCAGGYVVGRGERNMFSENWLIPTCSFAAFVPAYLVARYLLLSLLGDSPGFGLTLIGSILASTLVHAVLGAVTFFILARFSSAGSLSPRSLR